MEKLLDNGEYVDIRPWPVAELVGHLVAQAALGRRGLFELDDETDLFERETDRFELDAWAKLELTAWLDPVDAEVLDTPIGELPIDQAGHCADATLVASTIAWAIRVVDSESLTLPSDGSAEQQTMTWAPAPWTSVLTAVPKARLRFDEDLAEERERWEILYWRTTLFDDPDLEAEDRAALRELVEEVKATFSPDVAENDLVLADGTPFNRLDDDQLGEVQHEAELRLRTLNWVCGFGESPKSAPLFLDD